MSDDQNKNSGGPSLPPKLDLKKKGILSSVPAQRPASDIPTAEPTPEPASQPATPVSSPAPSAPKAAETSTPGGTKPRLGIRAPIRPSSVKSKTTTDAEEPAAADAEEIAAPPGRDMVETTMKIDLDDDQEVPIKSEKPKTIRINIPAEDGTKSSPRPTVGIKPAAVVDAGAAARGKSKTNPILKPNETSPISLERLGADQTDTQPKTIRLKRPGGPATAGKSRISKPLKVAAAKLQDADVDENDDAEAPTQDSLPPTNQATPTQKKTIRVKRPARGSGKAKPITIARAEASADTTSESADVKPTLQVVSKSEAEEDGGTGAVLTVIAGVAAVFVVGTLFYMLSTQAFPGMDFSWPGQI